MIDPRQFDDLTDEQLKRVDAACAAFESAIRKGEPIRIEGCVAAVDEELRRHLFCELLAIEFERRLPDDRIAQRAEFHVRFPGHAGDIERIFEETATSNDDKPETVSVPGYEIEGTLGRGAMGVVYKARDLKLKRTGEPGFASKRRQLAARLLPSTNSRAQ